MTVEMGDHDATPTLRQRFAGISVSWAVRLMNYVSDDAYGRYDRRAARLSLYGESEHAGDAFKRGRDVSSLTSIAMLGPLLPIMGLMMIASTVAALAAEVMALPLTLLAFGATLYGLVNVVALQGLSQKINVLDHTTEPAPDAVDELKERYVDGEIDESELGERAAEVWER